MYTHMYYRGCLTCASYHMGGRRMSPPLIPIKVEGPFERVGGYSEDASYHEWESLCDSLRVFDQVGK